MRKLLHILVWLLLIASAAIIAINLPPVLQTAMAGVAVYNTALDGLITALRKLAATCRIDA